MKAQLRYVDVSKWYGATPVLEGLNLEVAEGEFFVLLGPSGCGKTTILRMTAGLEPLTRGEIYLRGAAISRVPPEDRNIAMVFQDYALYPHMTVYQNMAFGLRRRGVSREETDARVRRTARLLAIEELLDRRPHQLSGGQQQRVALGRAIVRDPALYLMDEPLSNLDAQVRATVRAEIKQLQRTLGVTTLYVTHDQTEAMTLADRLAVLNAGTVQQLGAPLEVYRAPANEFVARFLASPRFNLLPGQLTWSDEALQVRTPVAVFRWVRPGALPAGAERDVRVGFRPEELKVTFAPAGGDGLPVTLLEALGAEVLVHSASPAADLVVRVPAEVVPERPERIWIRPEGSVIHLFDGRTGAALAHFVSG